MVNRRIQLCTPFGKYEQLKSQSKYGARGSTSTAYTITHFLVQKITFFILIDFSGFRILNLKMYISFLFIFQGYDGVEYLVVPLDEATMKEFLTQQEEES